VSKAAGRLVRRIQSGLMSRAATGSADLVTPSDRAALEDRLRHLRALGDTYAHVRLSGWVAASVAADVSPQKGGVCVATDA